MQVTVPKPDIKGRTEILNWYLKKIKVDPGVSFPPHIIKHCAMSAPMVVCMSWLELSETQNQA